MGLSVKDGGTWKEAQEVHVKDGGVWKEVFSSISSYSELILQDNPVAYYKLNETSGSTVNDFSGNNYNGTRFGSTQGVNGIPGAEANNFAYDFQGGPGNYVYLPTNIYSDTITIECWVFLRKFGDGTSNSAQFPIYFGNGDGFGGSGELHLDYNSVEGQSDQYMGFTRANFGPSDRIIHNVNSDYSGSWRHFVGTVDLSSNTMEFWQNGNKEGSITLSNTANSSLSITNAYIARPHSLSRGRYFEGIFDEVAIYDYVLSNSKIIEHANFGSNN